MNLFFSAVYACRTAVAVAVPGTREGAAHLFGSLDEHHFIAANNRGITQIQMEKHEEKAETPLGLRPKPLSQNLCL